MYRHSYISNRNVTRDNLTAIVIIIIMCICTYLSFSPPLSLSGHHVPNKDSAKQYSPNGDGFRSREDTEAAETDSSGTGRLRDPLEENGTKANDLVHLKRRVGLFSGVALIVGTMIGSGIFVSPSGLLVRTGSIGVSFIIWLACGLLSLLGEYTARPVASWLLDMDIQLSQRVARLQIMLHSVGASVLRSALIQWERAATHVIVVVYMTNAVGRRRKRTLIIIDVFILPTDGMPERFCKGI